MHATPAIRRAAAPDAPAITALVAQAYAHYIPRLGRRPAPMAVDYEAEIANTEVYVIAPATDVLGVVVLVPGDTALLLKNLAVSPRHQGQGLAKALMAFAEEQARERGVGEIELYTNQLMTENIAIYTHLGYREIRRVTENGFARVYLRKRV